jgi:serine/threonine protein kinase
VKILMSSWALRRAIVDRFVREAQVMSRLESPHVARLLDVGNLRSERGELPFLVLEYLDGVDLEKLLRDRGPLPWREAAALIAQATEAIADAHDAGIVHRDLKPSNLFLVEGVVKVLDFGIAKVSDAAALTRQDSMLGTAHYMAPEQLTEPDAIDGRVDVWALGIVLYELLTGKLPFPGRTEIEVVSAILRKPPLPLRAHVEGIPPSVEKVIERCLRKDKDARYPTVRDLTADLARIV